MAETARGLTEAPVALGWWTIAVTVVDLVSFAGSAGTYLYEEYLSLIVFSAIGALFLLLARQLGDWTISLGKSTGLPAVGM
jgi:hypothetical protein